MEKCGVFILFVGNHSVLPPCDSAINVLSIHPFLITLLFNQFSERNHTTVLRFHSYF